MALSRLQRPKLANSRTCTNSKSQTNETAMAALHVCIAEMAMSRTLVNDNSCTMQGSSFTSR